MFGWEFPPHISGGLGTACQGITTGLAANDVKVLFVVPKAYGNEPTEKIKLVSASAIAVPAPGRLTQKVQEALTFFEVNCPVVPYLSPEAFAAHSEPPHSVTSTTEETDTPVMRYAFRGGYGKDLMKEVWQYALTASAIAEQHDFDIVHAHDWLSFPAGIMAKEASGKPLVVHVHATEFDRSGENINMQVYETERQGMLKADQVIAVSELTRQTIIHRYHIPATKVITIHNAVAPATNGTTAAGTRTFPEKTVSFIGRVTYQKGPAFFIEAAAKILRQDKDFRFIMAGSGDLLQAMIAHAARLRISSHFHFTGFLKGAALDRVLSESDVYVMPSISEPFGISPLEAIRAGVPVIVSRQSGVQEVLQYALKVDGWDTDAMANAIYALARYKGLSSMLRRESAREVAALRWETQGALIKDLYKDVISSFTQ